MAVFKIPLLNIPQSFQISLENKLYILTCKFNSMDEGGWTLDISDAETNEPLANNLPVITGANILEGLDYLEINGELYAYTDGDPTAPPTLENLGIESNIYFVTSE